MRFARPLDALVQVTTSRGMTTMSNSEEEVLVPGPVFQLPGGGYLAALSSRSRRSWGVVGDDGRTSRFVAQPAWVKAILAWDARTGHIYVAGERAGEPVLMRAAVSITTP